MIRNSDSYVTVSDHVFADSSVICSGWWRSAARGLAETKGILGASVHGADTNAAPGFCLL